MRFLISLTLFLAVSTLPLHAQTSMEMKVYQLQNRDAQSLVSVAQSMVSPNGRVSVDAESNALIVLATEQQQQQLANVIGQLDQASKQVTMTVYVAEVSDSLEKQFGLRTNGQIVLNNVQFNAVLDLLDRREGGEIKNFMTATTMSNRPAYLQVSSDKFIPMAQRTNPWGGEKTYYERVPVGEFLEVLPRVNADGTIQVSLTPTVSRSGNSDEVVKRTATTNVTVPDGGTIAIGGSATVQDSNSQQNVPLLGIPIGSGERASSQRVMMFLTATTDAGGSFMPQMQQFGSDLSPEDILHEQSGPSWRARQHPRSGKIAR